MFHLSVLAGILTTKSSLARASDTETPAKTAGDALIAGASLSCRRYRAIPWVQDRSQDLEE